MNLLPLVLIPAFQQPVLMPKKPIQLPAIRDVAGRAAPIPAKGAKLTVVIFVATECPIANRMAPEMTRVLTSFSSQGVASRLVYPDATMKPADITKHLTDFSLPAPGIIDKDHTITKAFRAVVTPQAFVVDPKGKVLYVGRINDLYDDHGKAKEKVTRADLRIAIEEALAGKKVSVPFTQALGCFLGKPD